MMLDFGVVKNPFQKANVTSLPDHHFSGADLLMEEKIRRENPPGMVLKPVVNNEIKYQPQLVSRISSINSMLIKGHVFFPVLA